MWSPALGMKMAELIRPDLLKAFKPALLGRMTVVPYYPLGDTVLRRIIELQLAKIAARLKGWMLPGNVRV